MSAVSFFSSSRHSPATPRTVREAATVRVAPCGRTLRHRKTSLSCRASSAPVTVSIPAVETSEPYLKPLPRAVENVADDASLHNPLVRMERLSTGWFGVVVDFEGVIVEDTSEWHKQAWLQVASEMGLNKPLGHLLGRIKGVRNEMVVSNVFNWTHNPPVARKISARKEEIYEDMLRGVTPAEVPGTRLFLETLHRNKIPIALACAVPLAKVEKSLSNLGLKPYFTAIITAEDNGSPELENYFVIAAQQIQRPFMRCVVVGDSNKSVEAAHELGMKSVVVTGGKPVYNFVGADLVVRNLSNLSFINLKKLFGNEQLVEPVPLEELEELR